MEIPPRAHRTADRVPRWRPSGAFVVAVAVHVAVLVLLAALRFTVPTSDATSRARAPSPERLTFVDVGAMPPASAGVTHRPPSRQAEQRTPAHGLRDSLTTSPSIGAVHIALPSADSVARALQGAVIADPRAPAAGVEPRLADPRVWASPGATMAPGAIRVGPRPWSDRFDSAVTAWVARANDSVAALAPRGHRPGDWTFEKGGRKYGIDSQYIHLGKFSIPTAVLALLPLNVQTNPILAEESRANAYMRSDIMYHAERAVGDSILKAAAARIRARKERERRGDTTRVIAGTRASEPQSSP
jgi:hypothetical protein